MNRRKGVKPSYLNLNVNSYPWKPDIDYKKEPERYRVGKGEQGVLICEPYKSEIGINWRFRTIEIAMSSAEKIYLQFLGYLKQQDFDGADMSRKYLQMGYTRARRYANYKGGKKYDKSENYRALDRGTGDEEKAEAAKLFYEKWRLAEANIEYAVQKNKWKKEKG